MAEETRDRQPVQQEQAGNRTAKEAPAQEKAAEGVQESTPEKVTVSGATRGEVLAMARPGVRDTVQEMFDDLSYARMEEALACCDRALEAQPDFPALRYVKIRILLLVQPDGYAEEVLGLADDLLAGYPQDRYLQVARGRALFALGRYEEAGSAFEKGLSPEMYEEDACTEYALCLVRENRKKEAVQWFRMELLEYKRSGRIRDPIMLGAAFEGALTEEVTYDKAHFLEDLALWEKFLGEADLTSKSPVARALQDVCAETVVRISWSLSQKWLREPFRQLADLISRLHIFTGMNALTALSAHISLESYEMNDDPKVSTFLVDYTNAVSDAWSEDYQRDVLGEQSFHEAHTAVSGEERYEAQRRRLAYEWFLAGYAKTHREELAYVRRTYPHVYERMETCVKRAAENPRYRERILDEIMKEDRKYGIKPDRSRERSRLEEQYKTVTGR